MANSHTLGTYFSGCVMSRHRGAKRRRYELLGGISLLSPGTFYPLSDGPSIPRPPDHYDLLSAPARAVRAPFKLAYAITNLLMSDRD